MATIRYQHIARPGFLKRIRADVLRQFITPHQTYFEGRGLGFAGQIDCDHLGGILATPDADTPTALIEALEICDAVCIPEVLEELIALDHARETPVLDGNHSHADAVLLTWIHAPEAIERIHNRAALELDRSLFVYQASTPIKSNAFGPASLSRLRRALRPMFESQLRGSACRITPYPRPDGGQALVIQHGDPVNKTAAISDETGESLPVVFRPERIDLAFHDPSRNEWRISGAGKWLQDLYARKFAETLHEPGCVFARSASYTLQPLIDLGLAALDVQTDQVRDVRIAELQMLVCGCSLKFGSRNLHEAFEAMQNPLMEFGEPKSARLAFTIGNRRSQLHVTIHEGKMMVKGDIDHPAVEEWLVTAGFLHYAAYENETVGSH
jgi:hypothetical protein